MSIDRVKIDYELTFKTPFHFGTGIRAGLIDRTIVRDGDGYLYVPGSTFKGVLRERCEQLARIFGSQNHPGRLYFEDAHQTIEAKREYDEEAQNAEKGKRENDNLEDGKGKYLNIQTDLYTQVRLDRLTRTAG